MALPGEKNISAFVDPEVSAEFKQQCEDRKYFKNAALEGALRIWLTLNRMAQGELMEGKPKPESNDEGLDEEIRAFARSFAVLTQKLERRAAASARKKPRRKNATG